MKKIYDSVHGFIRFNELEQRLIDSAPFQRLHYIRQLGIAYLVYPGATHTRFEHSLGVMELASRIYDQIFSKRTFQEELPDVEYWRQIIRLSALCHDLGHLPFSHVAEKELLGKEGHEKWTFAIIQSPLLMPVWETLQKKYPEKDVVDHLLKMSIGEEKLKTIASTTLFSPWERVLSQIVCGDFFGADRIDYLLRDAKCTGVSYGLFDYHQLIEMLCILSFEGNLELGIEENGIESCEALLLARHFMHRRIYQYSSVKAHNFHLARFMKTVYGGKLSSLENYLALNDCEVIAAFSLAAKDTSHPGHKDALCLTSRGQRFHVLPINEDFCLEKTKQTFHIPDEAIGMEKEQKSSKKQLNFPVLKKNQTLAPASSCSDLSIPYESASYVYICPTYVNAFTKM